MQKIIRSTFLVLLISLVAVAGAGAQGTKEYRSSDDVDLPPLGQRKVLGTWLTWSISGVCTRRFEGVNRNVYMVIRCDDGSGGKTGQEISQVSANKFRLRTNSTGDHYVILADGNLSIRDYAGEIAVEPKHVGFLLTTTQSKAAQLTKVEPSGGIEIMAQVHDYQAPRNPIQSFNATSLTIAGLQRKLVLLKSHQNVTIGCRAEGMERVDTVVFDALGKEIKLILALSN